jgi:hypothetical protein
MFTMLKVRPPHGWNAVVWELAIVTLGVVIALAAQQAAESINQRSETEATRAALVGEIQDSLAILELRRGAESCIDRRLAELHAIVDQWGRTGSFTTPRWVSQAPWLTMNNLRVDAAQSAGRLTLFSDEEQYRFGLVGGSIRNFREIQDQEIQEWSRLRMLQSGPDALSASDRTAIRLALQDASVLNYRAKIVVSQALPIAASYGWRPDSTRFRLLVPRGWKGGKFTPSICIGIGTPPEQADRQANLAIPLPD